MSFPAFFEVGGQEIELLLREYVAICEAVYEVGRIDAFVYAEPGSVLGVSGRWSDTRNLMAGVTHVRG